LFQGSTFPVSPKLAVRENAVLRSLSQLRASSANFLIEFRLVIAAASKVPVRALKLTLQNFPGLIGLVGVGCGRSLVAFATLPTFLHAQALKALHISQKSAKLLLYVKETLMTSKNVECINLHFHFVFLYTQVLLQ
jgi:hypothetical protein